MRLRKSKGLSTPVGRVLPAFTASILSVAIASVAHGQDAKELEEVIITGSFIKGTPENTVLAGVN